MTEMEWSTCSHPWPMLNHLSRSGLLDDRKLRLFAVACCRRIWFWDEGANYEKALTRQEQYADGVVLDDRTRRGTPPFWCFPDGEIVTTDTPGWSFSLMAVSAAEKDLEDKELAQWAMLLRDVFGPSPFRHVTIDPSLLKWSDGTVPRIARGIYDEKAFGRMGVLADALLDAGCANEEILQHRREQEQVHVRGCWVLDLLLGKE